MKLLRWSISVVVLSALLVVANSSARAARSADAVSDLDAFITKALADYKVPGAAVAVVQDGKVILAKGYGVRDNTKPEKVDENTIFQLASVTKSLTGAAVASVVDEGKLDWDTPVTTYLPEFVASDSYMTRWMTERDLLAMRTGWPAFEGDELDSFGYDRAEIVHRLRYFEPRYSLREEAQYSNMGIFLAGEVAGKAAGMSWNDLVAKRVFEPLGMTRSGTVVKGLTDSNMAAGHALVDGKLVPVPPSILDTTGAASSGTSTAKDMANFMLMLLNKGTFSGKPVLKPESVQEIFKRSMVAEIEFSELPPISDTTGFYYGLGVDSYDYANEHIIEKAGALAGIRTEFTLVPGKNAGIVVLSNLNLTVFPEAVRAFYLNQVLGIDPSTDQDKIKEADAQISQMLLATSPAPVNPPPFLGKPEDLVGVYQNEYHGNCEIKLNGDALTVVCGPAKYTAALTHYSGGQFSMLFPGATQSAFDVTFALDAQNKAISFTAEPWGTFTRVTQDK